MFVLGKEKYTDLRHDSTGVNEVYVNANLENCKLIFELFLEYQIPAQFRNNSVSANYRWSTSTTLKSKIWIILSAPRLEAQHTASGLKRVAFYTLYQLRLSAELGNPAP